MLPWRNVYSNSRNEYGLFADNGLYLLYDHFGMDYIDLYQAHGRVGQGMFRGSQRIMWIGEAAVVLTSE